MKRTLRVVPRITAVTLTLLSAIALCLVATSSAQAADRSAWAGPTVVSQAVERDVQAILTLNPGSHRVANNAVEIQRGVVLEVGAPAQAQLASSWRGCSYYFLCMYNYAHAVYNPPVGAYRLAIADCGDFNLGGILMPDHRYWNDKITSVVNNQTPGTSSRFYDYNGWGDPLDTRNDTQVGSLTAPGYWDDLQYTSFDNRIDIVHVC